MILSIVIRFSLISAIIFVSKLSAEQDLRYSKRPNILFCISDDQSYTHTTTNGDPVIQTPAFDRVAREGLRFIHAFCDAPTCGPSRSSILTGQSIWRLEEGGNIHSTLPSKFITYTEMLKDVGYKVGYTGKGWSPGRLEPGGRTQNPAGELYQGMTNKPNYKGINRTDYGGNFENFLTKVQDSQPFCFWLGSFEPHRWFEKGSGRKSGKDPAKVSVPDFLPDNDIVRDDILDYIIEIEHFDQMVSKALAALEKVGLLENTIVVITSDHGMPFPRAKASLYDAGTRVPLAIRWPAGIQQSGREISSVINLSDLAPTFLDAAGIKIPKSMTGQSLMEIFKGRNAILERDAAFIAMERHDGCRKGGKGYPCRAIRTKDYLYIYNFEPSRWPSGSPDPSVCARSIPFGEVDSSPTKTFMMDNRDSDQFSRLFALSFGMRPAEELYHIPSDTWQMNNLAGSIGWGRVQESMRKRLFDRLNKTNDPRVVGGEINWDYYPYYGRITTKGWKVDMRP